MYSPALQRSPLATEAQYLLAKYIFETLGYRRYEWKCNALNAPSRRAGAALRLHLRRHASAQYLIAKGRNRDNAMYLDARQRMAGAQGRISSAGCRPTISPPTASRKISLAALNAAAERDDRVTDERVFAGAHTAAAVRAVLVRAARRRRSAITCWSVAIGWTIYDLTGSAFDLGLVGLIQFVPAVVLTLLVGHARRPLRPPPHRDRRRRRSTRSRR